MGPSGPTGPSGTPGTTLASAGQLGGLACTFDGVSGTTVVSFDLVGRITLTCATGATPSLAQLSIAPAGHSFGSVPVSSSANASFTVTNTGGSATGTVGTTTTSPFAIVGSTCTGSLAPAQSCSVTVRFSPTAGGPANGSLDVSASPGGTVFASLSGSGGTTAAPAALSSTTSNLSFGNVLVGTSSTSAFTVTNVGATTTQPIQLVYSNAAFSTSSSTCAGTALAPGATCTVIVRFAPTLAGPITATLNVSAPLTTSAIVTLNGTGTTPAVLSISPASHNFGSIVVGQTSSVTTFTVSNTGGAPSNSLTPSIAGPNASAFAITGSSCSAGLAPGTSCNVSVQFTPRTAGVATATLNLSNGFLPSLGAGLSGSGTPAGTAVITIAPSTLNFGSVSFDSFQDIVATVTNAGVVLSGPVIPTFSGPDAAAFAITGGSCGGGPLPPAGSCTVIVRFSPANPGTASATLTMSASPGGSATASLTGTGLAPAVLEISPATYSFGTVTLGQFRDVGLSVVNTGGSDAGAIVIAPLSSPYSVVSTNCSGPLFSSLAPGARCVVTVRFQPVAADVTTAILTVTGSPGGTATADLDGTGALSVHNNGFGGTYLHASPLGFPGNPATYNNSMAFTAAQSVFVGGAPFTVSCSGFAALQMNVFGVWHTWGFTGGIAGYAVASSAAPLCPTPFDRTWN